MISPVPASGGTVVTLRILHTNDVHGNLVPVPDSVVLGRPAWLGGSAYLATIVDQVRARDPQHTMLLDAGDSVHGSAATDMDEGHAMAGVMGAVGYDAGTIGNHDFQWGVPSLEARLAKNPFDNVIANVVHDDGSPLPNTKPFVVRDMGDVRVGVLGLLSTETVAVQRGDRLQGVRILDEDSTISRYLPEMEADVKVLLTHEGLAADRMRAMQTPGEGLIFIGGHSHSRTPEVLEVDGNYVVQAGSLGKEVGLLEIDYDKQQNRIVGVRHQLIPVDPHAVEPDPEVAKIVRRCRDEAEERLGRPFVRTDRAFTRSSQTDSELGSLVTDAMRAATGAQIALMNSDGLRANLPRGSVTLRDLYQVMPFGGELMVGEISGRDLRAAMERSVSLREDDPFAQSGFLQVSGLKMAYDASAPAGSRVLSLAVDGKPVSDDAFYSIALEDYLNAGKLGYTMLQGSANTDTSGTIMDAVEERLQKGEWRQPLQDGQRIYDLTGS